VQQVHACPRPRAPSQSLPCVKRRWLFIYLPFFSLSVCPIYGEREWAALVLLTGRMAHSRRRRNIYGMKA
jgi:hypothetical protein